MNPLIYGMAQILESTISLDLRPNNNKHRSFNGCWTCRLRRKKCDEERPVCGVCATLHITCFSDQEKPEWMDGGSRQAEMAGRLRRQVKGQAARRRGDRIPDDADADETSLSARNSSAPPYSNGLPTSSPEKCCCDPLGKESHRPVVQLQPASGLSASSPQRGIGCLLASNEEMAVGRSDVIHLTFYLDHLFPILFPFYRPSIVHGGKAWLLELMLSSPVVRQAILGQSSFFFSLIQGPDSQERCWGTVLNQTRSAFEVLRRALQIINGSDIKNHLHGAVRTLASIMQIQRFDIALLNFSACQVHLGAAVSLFRQLLDSQASVGSARPSSEFETLISQLGSIQNPAAGLTRDVNAEQAALHFSAALLIVDDIIASMIMQKQPKLYEYHAGLLGNHGDKNTAIRVEKVTGCNNWVLRQIGEITSLDAWKLQGKEAGSLDILELARRATIIKSLLETGLTRLDQTTADENTDVRLPGIWTMDCQRQLANASHQSSLVTRVWTHAALIYLLVVVSGWQPASGEVRFHVKSVMDLLAHQVSPPALLRTMAWPLCVAGCLAEEAEQHSLRELVNSLQPVSLFGTVRKALEIMEKVWNSKSPEDSASRDLSSCFRSESELILLV